MKPRFVYYWTIVKSEAPVAMYRDENNSDISADTLHERGLPVPPTPTYNTWKNLVFSQKRCGFCWAETAGTLAAVQDHVMEKHPMRLAA